MAVEVSSGGSPGDAPSACGGPLLGGVFLADNFLSGPLDEEDAELVASSGTERGSFAVPGWDPGWGWGWEVGGFVPCAALVAVGGLDLLLIGPWELLG